jgi:subtilisin-like proprotein convertase family protein
VADSNVRTVLQDWANAGGKLLIEGGEIGYDAHSTPGYPQFAAQVLHTAYWDSDNAGDLIRPASQTGHPLLNLPHILPSQFDVTYSGYGDQDAVEPDGSAYPVMVPTNHQADAGILVYDDNPAPQSAQIVYFAFNIEALAPELGQLLAENTLAYLLAPESPPTASLSGRVTLAGETDHSGVLVDIGMGHTVTTGVDGLFSFSDLYSAPYAVIASKDGWSVDRQDVVLGDGEHLGNINLVLSPILQTSYIQYPGVTIPDNDPAGVTVTMVIPASEAGPITEVNVDVYIQHTWIGDLTVVLTSPRGTSVVLHNRSGAQDDNILGNWPGTRPVDGPGSLDDFIGEDNAGVWTLFLSDAVGSDEGTLSLWGLNFSLPAPLVSVPDGWLPAATRLHGNVPNPFNPRTQISFELARAGKVQLDIYDVRGRLVSRLVDESMPIGKHQVTWDGTDSKGSAVSSGTYLYRLRADGKVHDRKMLLVR